MPLQTSGQMCQLNKNGDFGIDTSLLVRVLGAGFGTKYTAYEYEPPICDPVPHGYEPGQSMPIPIWCHSSYICHHFD